MRKHNVILGGMIFLLFLGLASEAMAISNTVQMDTGAVITDQGTALLIQDLVQIIDPGTNKTIDNPNPSTGAPGGDDSLVATLTIGTVITGNPEAGRFAKVIDFGSLKKFYVRAWNATAASVASRYGNSSIYDVQYPSNTPKVSVASFITDLAWGDLTPPQIEDVTFDGKTIMGGDLVLPSPVIEAKITDDVGVDTSSIKVKIADTTYTSNSAPSVTYDTSTKKMSLRMIYALADGTYSFEIRAKDSSGKEAVYSSSFKIDSGVLHVVGRAFNYPNPFNPFKESTNIGYSINKDATITVTIYDITARPILRTINSQKAGYSEVVWDGRFPTGEFAGNGVYLFQIAGEGKLLAKGKILVVKR